MTDFAACYLCEHGEDHGECISVAEYLDYLFCEAEGDETCSGSEVTRCPHDMADCFDPERCEHWHHAPDITVTVTEEMISAAQIMGATGAELLTGAVRSALVADPDA